jgi:LPS export ABC transporter protein LptC
MLLLAGMLVSCTNDLDRVAAIEMPAAAPDRTTFNAEYFFSDGGVVRNRLRAARIDDWTLEPARTEITGGLELAFFDSLGEPGSVLTARRGLFIPAQQRMEVYEEVVFVNTRGERLETEQLTWLQDSARVRTDKAVRIQRGRDIIHGQGLDAEQDLSRYTIHRITGVLDIAAGDTLAP